MNSGPEEARRESARAPRPMGGALVFIASYLLSGCGYDVATTRQFEGLEVGDRVPDVLPPRWTRGALGASVCEAPGKGPKPGRMESAFTRILTDENGSIVAKSQLFGSVDAGMYYTWRYKYVFECQIPQSFIESGGTWRPSPEMETVLTMGSINSLDANWDRPTDLLQLARGANHLLLTAQHKLGEIRRLGKDREARIAAMDPNAIMEVAFASVAILGVFSRESVQREMADTRPADYAIQNAAERVLYTHVLLEYGCPPPPMGPEEAWLLGRASMKAHKNLVEALAERDAPAAMRSPGRPWRKRGILGGGVAIENVNGKRIRVELAGLFTTLTSISDD